MRNLFENFVRGTMYAALLTCIVFCTEAVGYTNASAETTVSLSVEPEVEGTPIPQAKPDPEPEPEPTEQPKEGEEEIAATEAEPVTLSRFKDSIQTAAKRNPIVWGILVLIICFFTLKGSKVGLSTLLEKYKDKISFGEVGGTATAIGGVFSLFNGMGMAFDWNHLITNLIVGGFVAIVAGLGWTAKANEARTRKKDH